MITNAQSNQYISMVFSSHEKMLIYKILFTLGIFLVVFISSIASITSTKCTVDTAKDICSPDYPCCSKYGFCGSTEEHCSVDLGCIFGCWNTPSSGYQNSTNKPTNQSYNSKSKSKSTKTKSKVKEYANVNEPAPMSNRPPHVSQIDYKPMELDSNQVFYGCNSSQSIALTFDDGPSYYTNGILDILRDYGVKGTFFVIGSNINSSSSKATINRIVTEGHLLGSHTWSHPDLVTLSDAEIISEMNKTADLIYSITGLYPKFMRPPYGSIDNRVRNILERQLNYSIVMWNLDSNDWRHYRQHPSKIYASFVSAFKLPTKGKLNGSVAAKNHKQQDSGWISLQHDIYEPTLLQQEDIIGLILRRNLKIVPLLTCIGEPNSSDYR